MPKSKARDSIEKRMNVFEKRGRKERKKRERKRNEEKREEKKKKE